MEQIIEEYGVSVVLLIIGVAVVRALYSMFLAL